MGTALIAVYSALLLAICSDVRAEAGLELTSPYVNEIAEFAATSIAQDERFGLQDASLLMVLDARRSPLDPAAFVLTFDMGETCASTECQASKICEVHVLDAKESGQRSVVADKTKCATKETKPFTDLSGGPIATRMATDDLETLSLVETAVKEIAGKVQEEVSLLRVIRARQAWDGPSKLYYLTLSVESKKAEQSPTNEVCDVNIEEGLNTADNDINSQILRSLHCFTSSEVDPKSSDPDSFFRDADEDLPAVKLVELAEAAHALIDADSTSEFQSTLLAYSLVGSRVSPDSGVRETRIKLGMAPAVCLKSFNEDGSPVEKSCNVDTDRDAAMCTVTATQWPWVEGSYLFSDLICNPASVRSIKEELTPVGKNEASSAPAETGSMSSEDGVEEATFTSSSAFCTGCPQEVSTENEKIKRLAQFAMSAVDVNVKSDKAQGIVKIIKAMQQVVSGIKYELTLAVSDTHCERTPSHRPSCSINSESPVQHCKVAIIEQAWKDRLEVLETACWAAANPEEESREARMVGSIEDAAVTAPDVLEMAQFALETLDTFDENDKKRMLVKVLESKKQVVAGTLYRMKLQFFTSDCAESSSACRNSDNSQTFVCDVQVLSQPWQAASKKLLQSKCAPAVGRGPKAIPLDSEEPGEAVVEGPFEKFNVALLGEAEPASSNSDLAKRFAQHAVSAIEEKSNSEAKLKLVNIRAFSVQIVAGRLISMTVVVASTNCNRQDSVQTDICELKPGENLQVCDVEIWERAWLNETRVKELSCRPKTQEPDDLVVAASALSEDFDESPFVGEVPSSFVLGGEVRSSSRQKMPGRVGGYTPVDVADPKVVELAEFSKVAIASAINAREGVEISRIESAETQIVAGTNYRLKLAVNAGNARHSCQVVVFVQPWTGTRQVTSVSCAPEVSEPVQVAPKLTPDNPNDAKIQQIVAFSLPAIANDFNGGKPVALVQVESAESEVVSGVNYRVKLTVQAENQLYSCRAVVFDQPWIAVNTLRSLYCFPLIAESRTSGGTYKPRDPTDAKVQEMANFSLATLAHQVNGGNAVELVKITSAETQIVAGVNYKMSLVVSAGQDRHACQVIVWDQPWTSTRTVTDVSCAPLVTAQVQTSRGSLAGGYQTRDPSEVKVQEMAVFSLSTIGQEINGNSPVDLIRVLSAETQVVAGVNYKLKLLVGAESTRHSCEVVVFDQPWTGTRKVSKLACAPDATESTTTEIPTTTKRNIRGGYSRKDPSEPRIQKMAEFSLTAVGQAINSENPVQLVRIERAETQVVSGTNYKMKLVVNSGQDQHSCEVVVWDQPWTKTRKVTQVSCAPLEDNLSPNESEGQSENVLGGRPRPGREVLGGFSPADPNSADVKEMAAFSLLAISSGVNGGKAVQLVRVEQAATQIVAGINYKLLLTVSAEQKQLSCNVTIFDQSWTGTREVTDLSCSPIEVSRTPKAVLPSLTQGQLDKGYSPADPSRSDIQDIARFPLSAISRAVNGGKPVRLVRVDEADTQVVAGVDRRLKVFVDAEQNQLACEIHMLDQPWIKSRDLAELICIPDGTTSSAGPSLRDPTATDPDDPKVQETATFALSTISDGMSEGKPVRLVKVEEAATLNSAGVNYKLKLAVAAKDTEFSCDVFVSEQPWTGTRKVARVTCVPLAGPRSRRSVRAAPLGGWTDVDVSAGKIHEIANFSLGILNARSNEHNLLKFTRILKAQRQKVAGINYKIDLEVASVTCSQNAESESCTVDPLRELQICSVTVWDRPWLNQRQVTDLSCQAKKKKLTRVKLYRGEKVRRQLVGAPSAVDPSTPEMQEYAALALQAVNAQSNEVNQLKMVRLKDAAVQVVAGKNVILNMEVGPTTCQKGENGACPLDKTAPSQVCAVKIWDRPWLNDRRVTDVNCSPPKSAGRVKRSLAEQSPKQKRLKYMNAFRSFMAKHKKVYKNWAEFERRYKIYRENQKRIKELRENEFGTAVYGDTPFSDLTEDEFKRLYTGLNPALRRPGTKPLKRAITRDEPLPEEFDWRTKNAVTPVKNQGQCGSCWAFSVTGNVEGQYAIKNGKLLSFSEQELVDCDKLDNGCNGGLPENAYKAIQELGGLELEEDYPYDGRDEKCHLNQNMTQVQVTGGVEVSQNETEMAQWLIQNGPISIGINANGMQFYRGGISHPWKYLCRPGGLDHGVLIVGFGVSKYPNFNKTLPYWIIKNSWGTGWGEQGYYRIYRGDGSCGLNMMATSATIA